MLGTLPGPLGSWARLLSPDLAGFSWRSLGKAGQGSWACLGLGWTLWHSQNTLTHTPFRIPGLTLKVLFLVILGLFELCTFFWQFWHILVKLAHLHILQFWQSLAPHWPPKCHRASWGSAVRCKARDHARKVTITAVFR